MSVETTYLRKLLALRYEWMEARVYAGADKAGYGFLTPAMMRMFGQMGSSPVSISELARRLSVSRQAVHKMVNEAASHGLVEVLDNPDDGRVKLVVYSNRGREMAAAARAELEAIEAELAEKLREKDLQELKRILAKAW